MRTKLLLAGLAFTAVVCSATSALAAAGYVARTANLRAGPGTEYPVVAQIRRGTSLDINGCIENWNWCDVDAGPYRGWMRGDIVQAIYHKRRVEIIQAAPVIGIPVITFNIGPYWDTHYRSRPFYRDRARWVHDNRHDNRNDHRGPPPRRDWDRDHDDHNSGHNHNPAPKEHHGRGGRY